MVDTQHKTMVIKMNDQTYGGGKISQAISENLAVINDQRITKRVSAFMQQYFLMAHSVSTIANPRRRVRLMHLVRHDFVDKVNFHDKVDSFVKNAICARSKNIIKLANAESKYYKELERQGVK